MAWLEKLLRSKVFVWIVIVLPGLYPAWPILRQNPTVLADPLKYLLHHFGFVACILLVTVLSFTPLRVLFPKSRLALALNRHRRLVGVSAFFYALIHLGFQVLHEGGWPTFFTDIRKPFLFVGLVTFTILLVLAITSFNFMVRWLGGRRWKRLHRLAYLAAGLAAYHQAAARKLFPVQVLWIFIPLAALELARVIKQRTARVRAPVQSVGIWILSLLALSFAGAARADHTAYYQGEATVDGRVAYVEKHEVLYDDAGKLLEAKTRYASPAGVPIAEMQSDFRESVTVPTHTITDFRSGNVQGLRRENGKIILFDRDPGKPERIRLLTQGDADNRVLVGCQGLNYYLLGNLERLDPGAKLPLRLLIPGKLDYYDFVLEKTGESPDGIVDFEISIDDWFLRLFAPKLYVRYDRNAKHLVWYQGLSNITNEKGNPQTVTITYTYPRGEPPIGATARASDK